MLTEQEYKEFIEKIPNSEVPEVLFSVITKIHAYLESIIKNMSKEEKYKYSMFKVFYKQYNTILYLSQKSKYIYAPFNNYLDVKSINILIRSMHEMYLIYTYLCSSGSFPDFDKESELDFKYKIYQYSGENDNARSFTLLKSIRNDGFFDESVQKSERNTIERKEKAWSNVSNHTIYKSLSKELKKEIRKGNWKINNNKTLSWSDLAENSHLSKKYGILEYHSLSLYAHSTFSSLQLESEHDQDVDGLLCHCYILVSVFSMMMLASFNKAIDAFINKRELALVLEFYGMGQR